MPQEVPRQWDMFTGEMVDIRSPKQKRKAANEDKPQQIGMFGTQEAIKQIQSRAIPHSGLTQGGKPIEFALMIQDPRSEEDKEYDRMKAAEAATYALFEQSPEEVPGQPPERTKLFPSGLRCELRDVEAEEEMNLAIHIAEGIDLLFWSSRDAAYEEADSTGRQAGYRAYKIGEDRLQLWKMDESGYFRITYSLMDMIEDIDWIDQKEGL